MSPADAKFDELMTLLIRVRNHLRAPNPRPLHAEKDLVEEISAVIDRESSTATTARCARWAAGARTTTQSAAPTMSTTNGRPRGVNGSSTTSSTHDSDTSGGGGGGGGDDDDDLAFTTPVAAASAAQSKPDIQRDPIGFLKQFGKACKDLTDKLDRVLAPRKPKEPEKFDGLRAREKEKPNKYAAAELDKFSKLASDPPKFSAGEISGVLRVFSDHRAAMEKAQPTSIRYNEGEWCGWNNDFANAVNPTELVSVYCRAVAAGVPSAEIVALIVEGVGLVDQETARALLSRAGMAAKSHHPALVDAVHRAQTVFFTSGGRKYDEMSYPGTSSPAVSQHPSLSSRRDTSSSIASR